ncbi:siderophore-interacting protein [Kocuria rosea subsp. polaris]|uniref:Siderophore-interacting protein n=1 Tax=Kocuria rosea subsp. polaris TaxID=136273 RepID=A0A0W8I9E4_KOCRO|nr:siderophore-interacting protein [Kocuria polaris]KUG56532.1 siderophore-interacting protein [Kocuria polaris]
MTTTPRARPAKPRKPQLNLTVRSREQLSPSMVRVVLGLDEPERYTDIDPPEKYVKLVFLRPGTEHPDAEHPGTAQPTPAEPGRNPDYWELKETLPGDRQPVTRHLTIRRYVPERHELWMDFVLHGDDGFAGPWAARAEPGDRIIALGPGGRWTPSPDAAWTLIAADDAAVPAALAVLEALPASAQGEVLLEVDSPRDVQPVSGPEGMAVRWVFRADDGPGEDPALVRAVREAGWPADPGGVQVFAHGERELMKALREELFTRRRLERDQVSLSGYWARGRTEDAFQAEKKLPVGQII